jgi:dipeptidyl-peptidase-4
MRTGTALLACLALLATGLARAETPPQELTPERVFAVDSSGHRPSLLTWSPDGRRLAWLWGSGEHEELRALDPETGREEVLMRPAEIDPSVGDTGGNGGKGRKGIAIQSLAWTPDRQSLLLTAGGDLALWSLRDRTLRRLTATSEDEAAATISPDGRRVAFTRGYDLYVLDLATGRERALTHGGRENEVLNGVNDWLYEEEIWDRFPVAFWWSPDGRRIAYLHFEEDGVPLHALADEQRPPQVHWQKYPTPGDPNPKVKVGVVDVESGATTWMDTGKEDVYLARVAWAPGSDAVAVQRLSRDQKRLDLLRCAVAGACRTIATDTWPTWVNVLSDFQYLDDGRFVQGSDKSGWRRLYLHAPGGEELRAVTPEGWAVASLDGIVRDPEGKSWAVVTAFSTAGLGPIDRQVFRAGLDHEGWEPLTSTPGTHGALVAPGGGGSWIHTWSDADTPQRAEVRAAGKTFPLPYDPPSGYDLAGLPKWTFLTIPGPDGTRLPARMLEPAGFDPSNPAKKYPAIVYHYGGPGSQVVVNRWDLRWRDLWHKRMAQRGYVVLSVDSLSSVFFGKAGEDRDRWHIGPTDLAAQLAGIDYLKSLGWVDMKRIGLWGWSGGGSTTLYCLLHRPGVWKAGVAGAPVTDWRLYDTNWTERYLGLPGDDPEGYRDSPLDHAEDLRDALLIVHGLADDNVHPENTIDMIGRLVAAQRPFEDALYPGQRHGFRPDAMRHFFARMEAFFDRELR